MALPEPIDYKRIWLEDRNDRTEAINYTDCMESSTLRFVQACLADQSSLNKSGRPTMVDLNLARARVKDNNVLAFLQANPHILPASSYNSGEGFAARTEWARLMNNKPFFTYKRASTGTYKNDAITGQAATPSEGLRWRLEMEPCVHNIVAVCRHFLGCNLEAVDRHSARHAANSVPAKSQDNFTTRYEAWRLISRNEAFSCAAAPAAAPPAASAAAPPCAEGAVPFAESFGEARASDVSVAAQPHIDAALAQLSRPGMELRGRLCVEYPPKEAGFSHTFQSCLDLRLNDEPVWRWALTRTSQFGPYLVPPYDEGCERDGDGAPIFFTSVHSEIEVWDAVSEDWD